MADHFLSPELLTLGLFPFSQTCFGPGRALKEPVERATEGQYYDTRQQCHNASEGQIDVI